MAIVYANVPSRPYKRSNNTSKLLIQFAHVQSCMCTEAADCSCPFFKLKDNDLWVVEKEKGAWRGGTEVEGCLLHQQAMSPK